jgi:hypothetical protein
VAVIALVTTLVVLPACGPPAPPATPPPPRNCSLKLAAREQDDPLWRQLGCGPVMRWISGANAGVLGGFGSFCADDPDPPKDPFPGPQQPPFDRPHRLLLHARHRHGYAAGARAPCIDVPVGQLFVFWSEDVGPSCGSTCVTQDFPPEF